MTEADGSPGQWYLHLFDTTQPDFDWTNPEVGDEMESVIRFWLDRGADGFRIDVAHGLVKVPGLPDAPEDADDTTMERTSELPMWDQPGVHDIYRRWRKVTDSYAVDGQDADRILCAEAWVWPTDALAQYVRPDELHQSFNFGFLMSPWIASALRTEITASLEAVEAIGAPQTWVLSNHDVVRHASRLGFDPVAGRLQMGGIGVDDPQPDREAGLRRARAATTLMLALPGSAYIYQGEELGLPEATELPDEVRQDPTWEKSGGADRGRDGCRVPIPWVADAPSYGFGPTEKSWLPQPASYGELAVDRQTGVAGSTLELYRDAAAPASRAPRRSWPADLGRPGGQRAGLRRQQRVRCAGARDREPRRRGPPAARGRGARGQWRARRGQGVCRPTARCGCGSRRLALSTCVGAATLAAGLLLFVFWATICSTSRFQSCSRINR